MSLKIRGKIEPPFCWQSKEALRVIRAELSEEKKERRAMAVYVALTEVASNEGKSDFHVAMAMIANLSGYTRRSVEGAVKDLVRLNLLQVKAETSRAGYRDWSRYTLLSMIQGGAPEAADDTVVTAGGTATAHNAFTVIAPLGEEEKEKQTTKETPPKSVYGTIPNKALNNKGRCRGLLKKPSTLVSDQVQQGSRISEEVSSLVQTLGRREVPTFEEVQRYFLEKGSSREQASLFYRYGQGKHWLGSDGRSWNDWRYPANRFIANQLSPRND